MKNNAITIFAKLTPEIWVGLANVRENYGHDDSLPYQADIFIMNEDNNPYGQHTFKRIASIWNDGWGGESNVELIARTTQNLNDIKVMEEKAATHTPYWNGQPMKNPYSLSEICDEMACLVVDNPKYAKQGTLEFVLDDDPRSEKGEKPLWLVKTDLNIM